MKLNGVEVPSHYNGVGLHDTPGAETATWAYDQAASHARELRAHGVTLYKLFGSGTKGNRARAYRDNGIVVLHRWWPGGAHWGRPPAEWLMPRADYDHLVANGVSLFEPGWNEFNLQDEWDVNIPDAAGIARAVVDAWEAAGDRYGGHARLLFPSNTPGGHVDHRACYRAIVAEIVSRGLEGTVGHIAVHPRPFNNPPSETWSATNTVTFDEWRWIRDLFTAAGVQAYYWATEHGYSLGDSQNGGFPPIDLGSWTAYNWELFARMNPGHQAAVEAELAGVMYWFNAGWGHWGNWQKDALVDSPAPEMPAPSPLWIQMGETLQELAFSRYEDGSSPQPLPDELAEGIDVSYWQAKLDWGQLEEAGVSFVFIRTCRELTVDTRAFSHFDASARTNILRGGYHYLQKTRPAVQARLFWSVLNDQDTQLPAVVDVEDNDLNATIVRTFVEKWYSLTDHPLLIYTSAHKWHSLVGHGATWASDACDLWVAHWETEKPVLPDVWDSWLFWQYTSHGELPGYDGRLDRDRFNGTVEELRDKYGGGGQPVTPYRIEIEYRPGLGLIAGNYPVAGVPLVVTNPWGHAVTVTTGSKAEWGPGGFEVYAAPPGEAFTLYVEGYNYQVQTHEGLTVVRFIPV
ncbi:MAG: glycoside hydrolase family 25 protein [Anaerolineae bacterium]|jgi:GH25 family lysozyme M1 (1,4-beta-N-acetylmuramidase)